MIYLLKVLLIGSHCWFEFWLLMLKLKGFKVLLMRILIMLLKWWIFIRFNIRGCFIIFLLRRWVVLITCGISHLVLLGKIFLILEWLWMVVLTLSERVLLFWLVIACTTEWAKSRFIVLDWFSAPTIEYLILFYSDHFLIAIFYLINRILILTLECLLLLLPLYL